MSIVNKAILPIIAISILSGCATQAQQRVTAMTTAAQLGTECFKAADASEAGVYVSSKIMVTPISSNKLELLSSTRFVNDRDKEIILQSQSQRLKCRKLVIEKTTSEEAAILTSFYGRNDLLLAKLLRAELNIGDFNQQLQSSRELFNEDRKKNWTQLSADHDRENADASSRWAAVGAALQKVGNDQQNYLRQMALESQRNQRQETRTNCTSYGSELNCVTR